MAPATVRRESPAPATQMLSMRSALSTTACTLVGALAVRLGRHLEPVLDDMLAALLELSGRSNRIFVKNAETALKALTTHCAVRRGLLGRRHAHCGSLTDAVARCRRAGPTDVARPCACSAA